VTTEDLQEIQYDSHGQLGLLCAEWLKMGIKKMRVGSKGKFVECRFVDGKWHYYDCGDIDKKPIVAPGELE